MLVGFERNGDVTTVEEQLLLSALVPELGFLLVLADSAACLVEVRNIVGGILVAAFCCAQVPLESLFGIRGNTLASTETDPNRELRFALASLCRLQFQFEPLFSILPHAPAVSISFAERMQGGCVPVLGGLPKPQHRQAIVFAN